MDQKNIDIKPISEIINYHFFIPKYQRGYRWSERQVNDLLNDLNEFEPLKLENGEFTWYCLQPLVIKKRDENNTDNKAFYEVQKS